ncbi:hypothetical protein BD777DRAFT_25273 [Yarrowia lipolytica]|nr:hypothetical protein BD777DRAFT_25273 [Yarrowia lipolytica]
MSQGGWTCSKKQTSPVGGRKRRARQRKTGGVSRRSPVDSCSRACAARTPALLAHFLASGMASRSKWMMRTSGRHVRARYGRWPRIGRKAPVNARDSTALAKR